MRSIHHEEDGSGSAADEQSEADRANGGDSLARRIEELEKELARERCARALAESANRAKDEFLSVVSHELRSPLNAILGWNRILAIKRAQDTEVAAVTPRIERSARAQLKMVNDLLDFGRIGTGKLRISPRPLKLSVVAGMAIEATRPAAETKGIKLTLEPGPGGAVVADPDRLMQVMLNLLSNATKFTPPGGRIAVRIRDLGTSAELDDSRCRRTWAWPYPCARDHRSSQRHHRGHQRWSQSRRHVHGDPAGRERVADSSAARRRRDPRRYEAAPVSGPLHTRRRR
jgi:signal transduction histidine kinase